MANKAMEIVEVYYENGNLKYKGTAEGYKQMLELGAFDKPNGKRGASQKEPKPQKELKTYTAFEKITDTYTAKSVNSKGGNPNALLQIAFKDIPSATVRKLLGGFGYHWNSANKTWDNKNDEQAQKIFTVL